MQRETIQQTVVSLIEPLIVGQGLELVDLEIQPRRGQWLVRIYADAEGGIGLEDCRRLSREIGEVLDAADAVIPASYRLEVSSPGLDRPLRTRRDFQRQSQRLVRVFLHTPMDGQAQYVGRVLAVTGEQLMLQVSAEAPLVLPLASIERGVVELEFR